MILNAKSGTISLNTVKKLVLVTVKYSVFFAVRTEFLNINGTSFVFKGNLLDYSNIPYVGEDELPTSRRSERK
jgi:hypothetical protein